MPMVTETTNFYEGCRLILAMAGLYACFWAFLRTADGAWTFPVPVRDHMIHRRQVQLLIFAVIDVALGASAAIGASTPEVGTPTTLFLVSNWSIILTLVGTLVVTLAQVRDWEHFEDVTGPAGLGAPSPEEYRRLEHERNGYRNALRAHLAMLEDSDLDVPDGPERRPAPTPEGERRG